MDDHPLDDPRQRFSLVDYGDDTEGLHYYREGGYCPVHLGERFANCTYTIINKIGFGNDSTVWLARNNRYGEENSKCPYRLVALKFLKANLPSFCKEIDTLQYLQQCYKDEVNGQKETQNTNDKVEPCGISQVGIIGLIDHFKVHSPNGQHDVLVLPLVRKVEELRWQSRKLVPENFLQYNANITQQIFEAISFLHRHGVVHGDVRPQNVGYLCDDSLDDTGESCDIPEISPVLLFRYPDEPQSGINACPARSPVDDLPDPRNYEQLEPNMAAGLPKYIAGTEEWEKYQRHFKRYQDNPRVVLFDFSHSFRKETPIEQRPSVDMPVRYGPPEYFWRTDELTKSEPPPFDVTFSGRPRYHGDFHASLGDVCTAIDVWSGAGVLFELMTGRPPLLDARDPGQAALHFDARIPDNWQRLPGVRLSVSLCKDGAEAEHRRNKENMLPRMRRSHAGVCQELQEQKVEHMQRNILFEPIKDEDYTLGPVNEEHFMKLFGFCQFVMRLDPRTRPSASEVLERLSSLSI